MTTNELLLGQKVSHKSNPTKILVVTSWNLNEIEPEKTRVELSYVCGEKGYMALSAYLCELELYV